MGRKEKSNEINSKGEKRKDLTKVMKQKEERMKEKTEKGNGEVKEKKKEKREEGKGKEVKKMEMKVGWLVGWLVGRIFMAYQPLWVIKCQIHFYTNNQFYFKQISLTYVYSLIVKNISISSYSISQRVLIQTIQFSISIDFVYTWLNVKRVLFQKIQFKVSTASMSKAVPFQTIQFSISTQFNCQNYFKLFR